jgi:hypothetical protein
MELGTEVRKFGKAFNVLTGKKFRFKGTETDPRHYFTGKFNRIDKPEAEIPSVKRKVDSRKNNFAVTVAEKAFELAFNIFKGFGTDVASCLRNNAIGTAVVTAVLNLHESSGAVKHSACLHGFKLLEFFVGGNMYDSFSVKSIENRRKDLASVCGTGDYVRFKKKGRFVRKSLGITTGKGNYRVRVFAAEMAHHRAGFFIAGSGNGAGVYYVNVRGAFGIHYFKAGFGKSLLHDLCFILVDFTAKGIKSSLHSDPPSKRFG